MTAGRLKALVLSAWTLFLAWLILSGQVERYIGPRTRWVVYFGVACAAAVALGYIFLVMEAEEKRPSKREMFGFTVLLVPILLVGLVPEPSLGSLAASRKLAGTNLAPEGFRPDSLSSGENISFQDLSYATQSREFGAALGLETGRPVEVTGFVSDAAEGTGPIQLTRFSIYCCAADAVPFTVPVQLPSGAPRFDRDTWLDISGKLSLLQGSWVVMAEEVDVVDEPQNPYI